MLSSPLWRTRSLCGGAQKEHVQGLGVGKGGALSQAVGFGLRGLMNNTEGTVVAMGSR